MTDVLAFSILMAPFAVAAVLTWAARRSHDARVGPDPIGGGLSGEDSDSMRLAHELAAIRTRFEEQPAWPTSGATGERR